MEAEKKTKTGLSKSKVQEVSQSLAGTDVPQVHVPSDDNPEDLAFRTTVALPASDRQASSFVDASAGLIKDKELPAKMVPLCNPKSGLVHKKRRPDSQSRQENPLPSHSQESGTPEKDAFEPRYELRKRKK
ncbi:hypothetical protein BGZ81_006376 [Podila clonocystis]|nr:hypothetical protein BGZ81_006376 [Podila clonocystis]